MTQDEEVEKAAGGACKNHEQAQEALAGFAPLVLPSVGGLLLPKA